MKTLVVCNDVDTVGQQGGHYRVERPPAARPAVHQDDSGGWWWWKWVGSGGQESGQRRRRHARRQPSPQDFSSTASPAPAAGLSHATQVRSQPSLATHTPARLGGGGAGRGGGGGDAACIA